MLTNIVIEYLYDTSVKQNRICPGVIWFWHTESVNLTFHKFNKYYEIMGDKGNIVNSFIKYVKAKQGSRWTVFFASSKKQYINQIPHVGKKNNIPYHFSKVQKYTDNLVLKFFLLSQSGVHPNRDEKIKLKWTLF